MVDEFAEHQEVGEMELAAADGHRTAGLGLHQAALKILDAGDDVSRPVAKRRNVGMILTGVDERADVRDERADVVRDLVLPTRWRLATWSRASLARFCRERLTSRVLVQARR